MAVQSMQAATPGALGQIGVEARKSERRSYLGRVALLIRNDKAAMMGLAMVVVPLLAAVAAPLVAPYDPLAMESTRRLAGPGAPGHLLGTDAQGRDILSRLLYGGQVSMLIAFLPLVVAGTAGWLLGVLAGSIQGRVDSLIMRVMEVVLAFPGLLLAIAIVTILGRGMMNAVLALAIVAIPSFARITRAAVLGVSRLEYVDAATAIGASRRRVIFRHIVPNALGPVVVFATVEAGRMIIFAAGLAFLGLGVTPPTPEWGSMLSEGRSVLPIAPHVATIPGLVIFAVSLGLNLLGDSLQDALDPRSAMQLKPSH